MTAPIFASARPYVRWWWFSGPVDEAVIQFQLEWARANGFGGVEIAWMYPLEGGQPDAPWLSARWAQPIRFTAAYAARLGLGCDFTMGSAWPFGGFDVPAQDASQNYQGISPQRLEKSWETALGEDGGYILNHLDRHALARYAHRFGAALGLPDPALAAAPPGIFCDSWEVTPEGLWTDGFGEAFKARYGYDVLPYMPELDAHPEVRYDYRALLSDYALTEFYRPYSELCRELGGYARVQCHGAPADIVAAYALADIPESEAILFDADFAVFAASAAALAGKPVVSAEAFTCVYGWEPCPGPGPHQGEERLSDLKLIADGLMANGVNQVVWHGMPYNPPGGNQRFYATTHVGPESPLANDFAPFNAYMTQVCSALRRGRTYTDVAVYLPLEDTWMAGELPAALQKPSSKYVYELQETRLPAVLKGFRPLWITASFLRDAAYDAGRLQCDEAAFNWLYVDVAWMDSAALDDLLRLARSGLPICLVRQPQQPGRNQSPGYAMRVAELIALPNVAAEPQHVATQPPLVEGKDLPDFWCTVDQDSFVLFFANPATQTLRYPMRHDQPESVETVTRQVTINAAGRRHAVELTFLPGQSLLLTVTATGVAMTELHTVLLNRSHPNSLSGPGRGRSRATNC